MRSETLLISEFVRQPAEWKERVLGAHCYAGDSDQNLPQADLEIPCIHVPMQRMGSGEPSCEVWHGSGPPKHGNQGAIHYRHCDKLLFGVIELPETQFEAGIGKTPLRDATEFAYSQVFALLDTLGYPHLFRVWNYIAEINSHSFGLERYRQFNLGRQEAFLAHGRGVTGNVSAACALGFPEGPLTIGFLAGRTAPLSIENPRQISAYSYPREYGPRSPTFSRASLVRQGDGEALFISGTASIVGHATMHAADVVAQTRETMANIEAVLAEANRLVSQPRFDSSSLHYKVFLRNPADLEQVRAELTRHVGDSLKAIYLRADVCRHELLLEIEATAALPLVYSSAQRSSICT